MEIKISNHLINYIEANVFPIYAKNEPAHDLNHINEVINRSIELSQGHNLNLNMVYTIASYHDIGHHIDAKNHEKVSAMIMEKDYNLKEFFNDEELLIIKEAIEDHRASIKGEPRSIYGQIVSSADRNISVDRAMARSYLYGLNHYPSLSHDEMLERCFVHLADKFGVGGYAKAYIVDIKYEQYLKEIRELLKNKEVFYTRMEAIICTLEDTTLQKTKIGNK